jgi:hypothetical protein
MACIEQFTYAQGSLCISMIVFIFRAFYQLTWGSWRHGTLENHVCTYSTSVGRFRAVFVGLESSEKSLKLFRGLNSSSLNLVFAPRNRRYRFNWNRTFECDFGWFDLIVRYKSWSFHRINKITCYFKLLWICCLLWGFRFLFLRGLWEAPLGSCGSAEKRYMCVMQSR